jgi:hypothetical protein
VNELYRFKSFCVISSATAKIQELDYAEVVSRSQTFFEDYLKPARDKKSKHQDNEGEEDFEAPEKLYLPFFLSLFFFSHFENSKFLIQNTDATICTLFLLYPSQHSLFIFFQHQLWPLSRVSGCFRLWILWTVR